MKKELTANHRALVVTHLRVAEMGAARHWRRYGALFGFGLDDYKSAAYYGLVQAARRFDPARGVAFEAFAFRWTERYLNELARMEARANGWTRQPTKAERANGAKGLYQRATRIPVPERWENGESNEMGLEGLLPPTVEDHDSRIDQQRQLARVVALTSAVERRILVGRAAGCSYKEIGAACRISDTWARVTAKSACERVRNSYATGLEFTIR